MHSNDQIDQVLSDIDIAISSIRAISDSTGQGTHFQLLQDGLRTLAEHVSQAQHLPLPRQITDSIPISGEWPGGGPVTVSTIDWWENKNVYDQFSDLEAGRALSKALWHIWKAVVDNSKH